MERDEDRAGGCARGKDACHEFALYDGGLVDQRDLAAVAEVFVGM